MHEYRSCALKCRKKHDELRAYIWLRATIYLVNCLVKRSPFGLIAASFKCAAMVYIFFYQVFFIKCKNPTQIRFFLLKVMIFLLLTFLRQKSTIQVFFPGLCQKYLTFLLGLCQFSDRSLNWHKLNKNVRYFWHNPGKNTWMVQCL